MKPAKGRERGRDDMRSKSSAAGARIRVRKRRGFTPAGIRPESGGPLPMGANRESLNAGRDYPGVGGKSRRVGHTARRGRSNQVRKHVETAFYRPT